MTETKAAPEPSMEEILASIRQIINQPEGATEDAPDDTLELAAPKDGSTLHTEYKAPDGEVDPADESPEDDVMELTSIFEEETPPPIEQPAPIPEPAYTPPPAPQPTYTPSSMPATPSMDALITGTTAAAATAALSGLANTVYQERAGHSLPFGNSARTLESMVVEAIKPLLKDWCDEHLPAIVERVVTTEVEKLTKRISG